MVPLVIIKYINKLDFTDAKMLEMMQLKLTPDCIRGNRILNFYAGAPIQICESHNPYYEVIIFIMPMS